ncbi:unnamed protein product [Spirodela intermedia]|uniref:Uncharacterized protein n=2 Tax=Spirodela intermedia TaxID=51605 RepID=A0A7I8K594_SPIIN|nr:unnamed protein product [Spirodela intermedia]CAA6656798.1 unnamed protein product [Spirodela intermedia]CAA7392729.1 unnamed protein product [Spirodela intermedia]CAA7392740.1 unnamed protein product [Spirodela intermedia]
MATGTILSVSSANSPENRSKKGSRHVVPSGQTTRSPMASSAFIRSPSTCRSLDRRTVLIGERISESLEME